MTGVKVEVIVPKEFMRPPARFVKAIETALDGVAMNTKIDFQVTTQTWKNRPVFFIRKRPGEIFVGTTGLVYKFVSGGTRPHLITAHTPRGLAFYATGFSPKTRKRVIASYPGSQANRDLRRPMVVHHPGTEAREYPEVIAEKYDKLLPAILQRAIDSQI